MKIRDRIKELRRVPAGELLPNGRNWRKHPKAQQEALQGILAEIGYAGALIAYETPQGLKLIDGHLRASTTPESLVPVLILDVNDDEANKLLATLDPLAAMAEADGNALEALLRDVQTGSQALADMLTNLAEEAGCYAVQEAELPELDASETHEIQQMTFTVHDEQVETINEAIGKAKAAGMAKSKLNENTNGNALAAICAKYLEGKK